MGKIMIFSKGGRILSLFFFIFANSIQLKHIGNSKFANGRIRTGFC